MSIASPATCNTPSSLNQESTEPQRYTFVQHSDNVNASSTRRAVRSHAMSAVRRLQRQESAKTIRLKWPEEFSAGRTTERSWPDGQSAGFGEQHEDEEPIQVQRQEGEAICGTPHPAVSEPLSSADGHNSLRIDFQSSKSPSSEGARSLQFLERQDLLSYATTEVDEKTTPTFDYPQTLLGAGRLDPFQTSSIHINRSLAELVDHCVLLSFFSYKPPNHLKLCPSPANKA